jgi:hypothetical protein
LDLREREGNRKIRGITKSSSLLVLFMCYWKDYSIKHDIDETLSMHEGNKMRTKFWLENHIHLGAGRDGRIILRWILLNLNVTAWTEFK